MAVTALCVAAVGIVMVAQRYYLVCPLSTHKKSMVTPIFAILISDGCLACLNLSGVCMGHAPRPMRVAPGDPEKPGGCISRFLCQVLHQAGRPFSSRRCR